MGFSVALERGILDHIFGKAELEMGLMSLGLWGDSAELPNDRGYARVVTIPSYWSTASDGLITNTVELAFPIAIGGDWDTAIYLMLCDSPVWGEGTWYMYGELPVAWEIPIDEAGSFDIGGIIISLD